MERNSNTVSITRSVDIGVVAVMWNELMKISKGNANEKVERSIHNKKVKREVKGDVVVIRIEGGHFNTKVANNLGNKFNTMVCHVEAITIREMIRG